MSDVMVKDVMTRLVVMFGPTESVHQAARRLARNRISGAPVVTNGRPIGMVSEADLLRAVLPHAYVSKGPSVLDALEVLFTAKPRPESNALTVEDVMTSPVVRIAPEASVWRAAEVMERTAVKRLPVVDDDDRLIGIISRADLVKAMAKDDETIAGDATKAILVLGEENFRSLQVRSKEGVLTIQGIADRRTTHDLAVRITAHVPGVIEVIDHLQSEWDDTKVEATATKDPRFDWNPNLAATEIGR